MQKILKTLAVLTALGMVIVVIAGAVVTKTGSGDGCGPNWPLCHGQLFPSEPTLETIIEYTHRLVTGIVGLLVIIFSVWVCVKYRRIKEVVFVALSSIFFLILQSILGALAVVYGQSEAVMALHFGFSLLSYASVFVLAVQIFQLDKAESLPQSQIGRSMKAGSLFLWIYVYIVVYLGALVRHTDSEMGCAGWPLCNGEWIPSHFTTTTIIHYAHRLAALFYLIGFTVFFYHVVKHYRRDRILLISSGLLFMLAFFQVISGSLVVLSGLHVYPSLLHALIISLFFGILSYVVLYVYRGISQAETQRKGIHL